MQQIKVTLVRSFWGRKKGHKQTVWALGLKKIRSSSVLPDNPCIRGMINKVSYLLHVENL